MRRKCKLVYAVASFVLFVLVGSVTASETEGEIFYRSTIYPTALNIYYEARGEPELGQLMVAYVALKRAEANRSIWGGNSILGVVFRKGQFSWTSDSKKKPPSGPAWDRAVAAATLVATGLFTPPDQLVDATSYMNPDTSVSREKCRMAANLRQVGIVGNHYFYRELEPGEAVTYIPPRFNCKPSTA